MTMLTIRKLFIIVPLAFFTSALLLWGVFDTVPSEAVVVTSLLLNCYVLVRDFILTTYIERYYAKTD